MPIPFTCPNCQRTGRLPDTFKGDRIKCPACQTISLVKNATGPKASPAPRKPVFGDEDEPVARPAGAKSGAAKGQPGAGRPAVPVAVIVGGSVGVALLSVVAMVVVLMSRSGERPAAERPKVAQAAPAEPAPEEASAPAESAPAPAQVVAPAAATVKATAPAKAPTYVATSASVPTKPSSPAPPAAADAAAAALQAEAPADTVARIKDATVFVKVKTDEGAGSGSGFVIQVNGDSVLVVTNHHVVTPHLEGPEEEADPKLAAIKPEITAVFRSGQGGELEQAVPATVIATEREANCDLAVLLVKGVKKPPRPIVLTQNVALSETMPVLIYGFPLGEINKLIDSSAQGNPAVTVSRGSISSIRKDETNRVSLVQIDGSIVPGNSGGPVVDEKGRLIGVAVAQIRSTNIGFAVPAADVLRMLDGRIGRLSVAFQAEKQGAAALQVKAKVIDPLNKLRDVAFHFAPASNAKPALPKPNPDGTWPALPGATRVRMAVQGQAALAALQAPVNPSAGRTLLVQASYVDSQGRTFYTIPVAYEIPTSPTGLVAIGKSTAPHEAQKMAPTFKKLGSLLNDAKQCTLVRDEKSMTINVPAGVHLLSADFEVKNAPMVLADVEGDFFVTVHSVGDMLPGSEAPRYKGRPFPFTFQGAGLLFWVDKNNYVRLERTAGAGKNGLMINKLLLEACKNGKTVAHLYPSVPEGSLYIALMRTHGSLQIMISPDGRRWARSNKLAVSYPLKAQVGLSASNVSKEPFAARFEDFVLMTDSRRIKQLAP